MNRHFVTLVTLTALLPAQAFTVANTAGEVVSDTPCQSQILEQLENWGVTGRAFGIPAAPGEGMLYRLPTRTIGTWVLLRADDGGASARRVSAAQFDQESWDAECRTTRHSQVTPRNGKGGTFDDADLASLLDENGMGLIYVWSPHMLLSVEGVNELRRISKSLGIGYTVLLDPAADVAFARASAEEAGLPVAALRRADSVELSFRDLFVHAPSLLLYRDGEFAGPAIPGYRAPEHYRQTIVARLRIADGSTE